MDNVGRLLPFPLEIVLLLTWHLAEEVGRPTGLQKRALLASPETTAVTVQRDRCCCCCWARLLCMPLSHPPGCWLACADAVPRRRPHLGRRLDH